MAELTPVTFKDVAVCFSEEEWRLLAEWEKQLYKNVMQEIHGALLSLGYAIVNPDIVFRIKKAEPPYPWGKQPQKGTDTLAGSPSFNPDLLLSVTRRKELCSRDRQASEESNICNGSSTDQPAVISAVPVTLKQEEEPCHMKRQDCQIKEHINYSKAIHPVVTSVFSLRVKEEETHERGKYMRHPTSNYQGISPEEPFQIPPEEPDFTSDPVSCGRAYTKNELTTGCLPVHSNAEDNRVLNQLRASGTANITVPQEYSMGPINKGSYTTWHKENKSSQYEHNIQNLRVPIPQLENHVQESQHTQNTYTEVQSDQSNNPLSQGTLGVGTLGTRPSPYQLPHVGERQYQCNECKKCFWAKSSLVEHRRIHTGERPFKCSYCERSFIQISSLIVHRRTHNGERPYKCQECEKCFTCSSNLLRHQRTHVALHPRARP